MADWLVVGFNELDLVETDHHSQLGGHHSPSPSYYCFEQWVQLDLKKVVMDCCSLHYDFDAQCDSDKFVCSEL